MSKPVHAATSPRSSITHRRASGPVQELWDSELSMVLGGQSRPTPGEELSNQFGTTFKAVKDLVAPVLTPIEEGFKLALATGNYVRWAAEHQESHEISEERGQQLEAEEREWEEQKQREEEQERERLLQGDKPTTPAEVAQWLDATNPPYSGELPTFPSHMVNPGPSHEPQIFIEPWDGAY